MKFILTRRYNENNTIGILRSSDCIEVCKIGEPPLFVMIKGKKSYNVANRCCIPEGIYTVRKHTSQKFGKCFAFNDKETAPRASILIHSGNFFADCESHKTDSHGCLICGDKFADLNGDKLIDVANSRIALQRLYLATPDEFMLEIISEK